MVSYSRYCSRYNSVVLENTACAVVLENTACATIQFIEIKSITEVQYSDSEK